MILFSKILAILIFAFFLTGIFLGTRSQTELVPPSNVLRLFVVIFSILKHK